MSGGVCLLPDEAPLLKKIFDAVGPATEHVPSRVYCELHPIVTGVLAATVVLSETPLAVILTVGAQYSMEDAMVLI